jgi:oligopeptide transport system substrate-binding protein
MRKLLLIPILLITMFFVSIGAPACGTNQSPARDALQSEVEEAEAPAAAAQTETAEATPTDEAETAKDQETTGESAAQQVAKSKTIMERDHPVGGTMTRLFRDPPTLDPHKTSDTTSAFIIGEVFSGLVTLNTDLQIVPDIAERWDISDDGLVYTFHLLPDATFADGKPITAHDFVYSLNRAADPELASPVSRTYLSDIVGVTEVLDGAATEITGVKAIDEHTLEITIDAPKAYFLAKLTYPTAFVLDRENVEAGGRNWTENPNGTGPFRLAEYRIGERIILERNENFYRQPAHVDSISMNLAGGQAMAMYENDEIDITGVGLFDLDRVLDPNEELNKELIIAPPDFSVSYVGFNTSMPPFDDPKFRQALNHAVDKELIATEVLSELVEPAYGILPPGFPGYNENLVGLEYDPEFARQLLAESKYADPDTRPRIEVTVPGTGGTIGLDLEVIIEMWRQELGVEVEIQQVEWATYLEDLNQQRFQAYGGLGWQADYPDPQDFLDILFHTESSINHGAYSNPELDAVLEEARTEADLEKRVSLYHQAEKMIVDDAAWLPLWYAGERYVLIKPHVENYRVTPMIIPKLKEIRITDG